MMITVEDGTIIPNANSYIGVDDADSYFSDRGNTVWAAIGDSAGKAALLIRATDYIDARFSGLFIGERQNKSQSLEWPRVIEIADHTYMYQNVIPQKLKWACCEYALRANAADLAPDLQIQPSGLITVETTSKVGPIETQNAVVGVGYGSQPLLIRPYPAADMLLRGLVRRSNTTIR